MRRDITKERLRALMAEIARTAPRDRTFRVYLVGGGTAVYAGWRPSSIDADFHTDDDAVFRDIQGIKERLGVNVEFVRPEHVVPSLVGSDDRHVFLESVGKVSFFHYDPYAQVLSKIVRGFDRDLHDAQRFIDAGMVDGTKLLELVRAIPEAAYARYPSLSPVAVNEAVREFVESR